MSVQNHIIELTRKPGLINMYLLIACQCITIWILEQTVLHPILERVISIPLGFGLHPSWIYITLISAFWITHNTHFLFEKKNVNFKKYTHKRIQSILMTIIIGGMLYIIAAALQKHLIQLLSETEEIQKSIIKGCIYAVMFLITPIIVSILFPKKYIRQYRRSFMNIIGITFLYIFISSLQFGLHRIIGIPTLYLSASLIDLFSNQVQIFPADYIISYQKINVQITPTCLGINSIFLFIALMTTMWTQYKEENNCSTPCGLIILTIGIFLILLMNIVRITIITIVGAWISYTYVNILHQYIGAILLMMLLIIFIKWIIPKMHIHKK